MAYDSVVTTEAFLHMSDPPHGGKMELVAGEVVTQESAGGVHGVCQGNVSCALSGFARERAIGVVLISTGFVLARRPDTVLAPDVSFTAMARLSAGLPEGFIEGAPTLAVEVKSPEDRESEILRKVAQYLDAGTERMWVVRPRERTVTVHRADSQATRSAGEALNSDDAGFATDGFALAIDELFA